MENNSLIMAGGVIAPGGVYAIKGKRVGKLSGMLCLFSTANDPDSTKARDFFNGNTDFKFTEGMSTPIYFHHGLDRDTGVKVIGTGTLHRTTRGIEIKAEIDLDDPDGLACWREAKRGRMGWSSGTAEHLMQREPVMAASGQMSHHITHWPLGLDASLTPNPAEPRNRAVAIKSLIAEIESIELDIERLDELGPDPFADDDEDIIQSAVKFDENEPRDEDGKWSGGGSGTGSGPSVGDKVMRSGSRLGAGTVTELHGDDQATVRWHDASQRLSGNHELHTRIQTSSLVPHSDALERSRVQAARNKMPRTLHAESSHDAHAIAHAEREAGRWAVVRERGGAHVVDSRHASDTSKVQVHLGSEAEAQAHVAQAVAAGREAGHGPADARFKPELAGQWTAWSQAHGQSDRLDRQYEQNRTAAVTPGQGARRPRVVAGATKSEDVAAQMRALSMEWLEREMRAQEMDALRQLLR